MEHTKNLVFVSYAHEDRPFLEKELLPVLRDLELNEEIELWEDRLIGVGNDWYAEIVNKMDHAKVAILLVTQPFLASKFCQFEEIPVLLQRARRGEIHIMPLIAKPCRWQSKHWLRRLQVWPSGDKALSEHEEHVRQRLIADFGNRLEEIVNDPSIPSKKKSDFDVPNDFYDLHRLPQTGSLLFGRSAELKLLDHAWDEGVNLIAFTASGGAGKSTLIRVWAEQLAEDNWRGAERVFAWSFYSQGTGRITDSEIFLNEALKWFGAKDFLQLSIWDRAELLADLIRKQNTLLILDGIEPLQSSETGVDRGHIRYPGLRTLLEELATKNIGLCVITTREHLVDLSDYREPQVVQKDLDQISQLAGRALLRVMQVKGDDKEIETVVMDLGGSALAVSLLGRLLKTSPAPHIAGAKQIPELQHAAESGGHPKRVLKAWVERLDGTAEIELMHLIGLFDRPVSKEIIKSVARSQPIWGVTIKLSRANLDHVIENLRRKGLLSEASQNNDELDTHPVIREYFGERLKAKSNKSWLESHRRIYKYYQEKAKKYPDNLEEMQPLFAAVMHGCAAK